MIIRVLDLETTGFPPNAGVCEVGWTDVFVSDRNLVVSDSRSILCNPGRPIGAEAAAVHGITDDMVAGEDAA